MEVSTKLEFNPIKQDIKKGKLRYFTYGDLPFNYGMLSQTWEDPTMGHRDIPQQIASKGDNDPLDVVELSAGPIAMGAVCQVKILGCLALIDEGEIDWKLIGIRTDSELANKWNNIEHVDREYIDKVVHWFRYYKTTDGKPENVFALDGKVMNKQYAYDVIAKCNEQWAALKKQ